MSEDLDRATRRIERYRLRNPDAVRLARLASLAVRVEPHLLRRLRLELLPELDVGTEADVWFGPLVESRGADAVVLDPQAVDVLRGDLARERELFERASSVTRDAHTSAPPSIRLEEEINRLALLNDGNVVAAIDEALRPALRAMTEGGDRAHEIAHWARRALPRVHPAVRQSENATLLVVASNTLLGSGWQMKAPDSAVSAEALAWILSPAALSERVRIGVELVAGGVRFVDGTTDGSAMELPRTNPLFVELEWTVDGRRVKRLVEPETGRTVALAGAVAPVMLRTLAGDEYVLERVEADEAGDSTTAPTGEGKRIEFSTDVFISYAHIDDQALEEGQAGWISDFQRALQVRVEQLLGKTSTIWRDPKLQGNDIFSDALEDRLRSAALLVAVLSPRYLKSDWCRRELELFVEASAQRGGLRVGDRLRLFKVLKAPIPLEQQPPALRDVLGYEFFNIDPGTGRVTELGRAFGAEGDQRYWIKLDDLAHDIADMLKTLAGESVSSPSSVTPEAQQRPQRAAAKDRPRVYLICERHDVDSTRSLVDFLFTRYEVTLPLFEGDESEVRQEHEANLSGCDAVLIYYGASNELWLRRKLRELQKIGGYGRTTPLLAQAVYIAPPFTADKDRFRTQDAIVIRQGDEPLAAALKPFLDRLIQLTRLT